MIAQQVEAPLDLPDEGLVRVFFEERRESAVGYERPQRDLVQKRREYAGAGIPAYWIVNPTTEQIIVLHLEEATYVEHGVFTRGAQATSVLLEGFTVAVTAVLDAV